MNSRSISPPRRFLRSHRRRARILGRDPPTHIGDVGDEPFRVARRAQHSVDRLPDAPPAPRVAGDRARAGQRHVFPGPGGFALVTVKAFEARGDRPRRARGTQPHIDRVERPLGGRCGDRADQALAQPRIIGRGRERLRAVRCCDRGRRVVDHDQIEIGGEGHLAAAETPHADDRKRAARHPAVAAREIRLRPPARSAASAVSAMSAEAPCPPHRRRSPRRSNCTPTWKPPLAGPPPQHDRACRRNRAAPANTCPRSAASPARSGIEAKNSRVSTASSNAGRCANCSARRGAPAMMSATKASSPGLAWNSENSCTPAGRSRQELVEAAKGLVRVRCRAENAQHARGTSSVRISRARWLRKARIRP